MHKNFPVIWVALESARGVVTLTLVLRVAKSVLQDLSGVQKLQKRLHLLEMDISGHQSQIEDLSSQAKEFEDNAHFDAATIREKQKQLVERYEGLQVPLKKQKERLEASHQLQQFFRDMEDEWAWIKEREPLVTSTNTGKCVCVCCMFHDKHLMSLQAKT